VVVMVMMVVVMVVVVMVVVGAGHKLFVTHCPVLKYNDIMSAVDE